MNQGDLTREQAEKIAELTSSVFEQGGRWVFRQWDLETGVEKLTRNLPYEKAQQLLKKWRRERIETLLRANEGSLAYGIKIWHQNPSWQGEGIWEWAEKKWYTSKEVAEERIQEWTQEIEETYQIFELPISQVPGHFTVYLENSI
jgi:hypothetical protein